MLLGLTAAVAYASWPLAFLLNRPLAGTALASTLEARGQPYCWLFISLDCLTGLCTVGLAYLARVTSTTSRRWSAVAIVAYALFGLATMVDALIPYRCGGARVASCGADLSHLTSDDLLTALAVLALFVATLLAVVDSVKTTSSRPANIAAVAVLCSWGGCGLVFFATHFSRTPPVALQHVFLSLSAGLVLLVPTLLWNSAATARRSAAQSGPRPGSALLTTRSGPNETYGVPSEEMPIARR